MKSTDLCYGPQPSSIFINLSSIFSQQKENEKKLFLLQGSSMFRETQ